MDETQTSSQPTSNTPPLNQVIMCPVDRLHGSEYNPRTIKDDRFQALVISMRQDPKFFAVRFVVANMHPGREYTVFMGNQRLEAAKTLGMEKVPVMFVDVDEATEKVWALKDNHHQGEDDQEKLKSLLGELHTEGVNMAGLGFTMLEIESRMEFDAGALTPQEDGDNHGTTPRAKKEVACPECGCKFQA